MKKTVRTTLAGALSLVLALSSLPTQGIAYALAEGRGGEVELQVEGQDEDTGDVEVQADEAGSAEVGAGAEAEATTVEDESDEVLQAQADTTNKVAEVETPDVGVRTYTQFDYALNAFNAAGGSAKLSLLADVQTSELITFVASPGTTKIIDLNGNTLTVPHAYNEYSVTFDQSTYSNTERTTFKLRGGGTIQGNVHIELSCNLTMDDVNIQAGEGETGTGVLVDQNGSFTMNGGSITGHNESVNEAGGVKLKERASFTMNGGTIAGNSSHSRGGGVYVGDQAAFTMNGGKIANNTALCGGGVFIYGASTSGSGNGNPATFTMTGGGITGNKAIGDMGHNGGGVYVGPEYDSRTQGVFKVSGNPVIKDNVRVTSASYDTPEKTVVNNVYLRNGSTIAVSDALSAASSDETSVGASIGVTVGTPPADAAARVVVTTGYKEHCGTVNPGTYFKGDADPEGQAICVDWNSDTTADQSEAALRLHEHSWRGSVNEAGDGLTLSCKGTGHEYGGCPLANKDFSLRFEADNKVYDGKSIKETNNIRVVASDDWVDAELNDAYDLPQIPFSFYYKQQETVTGSTTQDEDQYMVNAPKDAGAYIARVGTHVQPVEGTEDYTRVYTSFEITKRPITVTCEPTSFTYNGQEQGPEVVGFNNLVEGEALGTDAVELASGTLKERNAGSYQATFKLKDQQESTATTTGVANPANYEVEADSKVSWSIAKATLTVTPKDSTIKFGAEPAAAGITYTGLQGTDTEAVVKGTPAYSFGNYRAGMPAGTYPITVGGLSADNYDIAYATGRLTVGAAPVPPTPPNPSAATVSYSARVQKKGAVGPVTNGAVCGAKGKKPRIESISVRLVNPVVKGSIEYRSQVQGSGWGRWSKDGAQSGTVGKSKRLEAMQMRLTGEMAQNYDVFYRVRAQTYGWMGWAKNGAPAGTSGTSKRLEAYEVLVLPKGQVPKDYKATASAYRGFVSANVYVQKKGWLGYKTASKLGTKGKSQRLEAFRVKLKTKPYSGGISYRAYVQKKGWRKFVSNGKMAGTKGKGLRIEAVEMKLTGEMSQYCDVWYRTHSKTFGWSGWTCQGPAGSTGYGKRVDAVQVLVLSKGSAAPGSTAKAFRSKR